MLLRLCGSVRSYMTPPFTSRRPISASDVAAALRPFYFSVHPDLFGQHPEMRSVNENSLKQLNGFLDSLYSPPGMYNVQPLQLTFYMRSTDKTIANNTSDSFRAVVVRLRDRDPSSAVRSILESCQLANTYVASPRADNTERSTVSGVNWSQLYAQYKHGQGFSPPPPSDHRYDVTFDESWILRRSRKQSAREKGFHEQVTQLTKSTEKARVAHEVLMREVELLTREFCNKTGIAEICWDTAWSTRHLRGALGALGRIYEQYRTRFFGGSGTLGDSLVGKRLRFGSSTFIAADQYFVLGVEDVPEDWLKFLQAASRGWFALFAEITQLENALSEALGNAHIGVGLDTSAAKYRRWLADMVTRVRVTQFPEALGAKFKGVDLMLLDPGSCGTTMFMSENGAVMVSADADISVLCDFLKNNADVIRGCSKLFGEQQTYLLSLADRCTAHLRLRGLTWDNSISYRDIVACLERMMTLDKVVLSNQSVMVARKFSVQPDGVLSIPFDWVL